MTREEAIEELKILKEEYWDDDGYGNETEQYDDTMTALDMAIKALEQEHCDDCVRRQEVLDVLKDKWNMFSDANDAMQESIDTIKALKSVTPQPKMGRWIVNEWTFTSERHPENDDEVIAYDGADAFVAWYGVNGWHSTDNRFDPRVPIIEWKPINLPKAEEKTNDSCWKEYYKSKFNKKV